MTSSNNKHISKNSCTLTVDTWKVIFTADGGELEVGGV